MPLFRIVWNRPGETSDPQILYTLTGIPTEATFRPCLILTDLLMMRSCSLGGYPLGSFLILVIQDKGCLRVKIWLWSGSQDLITEQYQPHDDSYQEDDAKRPTKQSGNAPARFRLGF
jgi:hypothetical protein